MKMTLIALCALFYSALGLHAQGRVLPKDSSAATVPLDLVQQLLETTMKTSEEVTDKLRPAAAKLHEELVEQKPTHATYDEVSDLLQTATGCSLIYEHLVAAMSTMMRISAIELRLATLAKYREFFSRAVIQHAEMKALLEQVIRDAKAAMPLLPKPA